MNESASPKMSNSKEPFSPRQILSLKARNRFRSFGAIDLAALPELKKIKKQGARIENFAGASQIERAQTVGQYGWNP